MKTSMALRCLRLNRAFYDAFAPEFSASRRVIAPGIRRALASLGPCRSLLDLGCGDGRILRVLRERIERGELTRYVGVDFSERLLERARKAPAASGPDLRFLAFDLAAGEWPRSLAGRFEAVVCLSVLFHIPGARRRIRLLRRIHRRLLPGGRAVISVWRFLHVPRLVRRILPWEAIGAHASEVDPGDFLIEWRRGGSGMRYVHHFEDEELERICRDAGFTVRDRYTSDGETGDMGSYLVLSRSV